MLGVRQSGMQAFKFARLPEDVELLERARRWARQFLDHDPELQGHPLLAEAIARAYGPDAVAPIPA
jgi:ATP-dependent DNA helicase RecG